MSLIEDERVNAAAQPRQCMTLHGGNGGSERRQGITDRRRSMVVASNSHGLVEVSASSRRMGEARRRDRLTPSRSVAPRGSFARGRSRMVAVSDIAHAGRFDRRQRPVNSRTEAQILIKA